MQQQQTFGPLTMTVRPPRGRPLTVSAFCPVCGVRRAPVPVDLLATGRRCWVNPCGHVESFAALALEEAAQCAAPGCVLLGSVRHYPYCSADCAADQLVE